MGRRIPITIDSTIKQHVTFNPIVEEHIMLNNDDIVEDFLCNLPVYIESDVMLFKVELKAFV